MVIGALSIEATALIFAWVAIVLLTLASAGLLRQVRVLRFAVTPASEIVARAGPQVGANASELASSGQLTAAVFIERDCRICDLVRVRLPRLLKHTIERPRLLFISSDNMAQSALPGSALEDDSERSIETWTDRGDLFDKFGVLVTPYAMVIDKDGRLALSEPIGSIDALEDFVAGGIFDRVVQEQRSNGGGSTS